MKELRAMSKYKTRGDAVKDLRRIAGLSQEELARRLNTTKQTIYKYETGIVTNIPSDKIEQMSRIFGVSPAVIMGWDEPPTAVPVYSAAAGQGRCNDCYPDEEYPMRLNDDEFLFRVAGRSMEPTLHDGDLVIISSTNVVDNSDQIALVQINGDEATLKHVQKDDDGIMLIAENYTVFPPKHFSMKQVDLLPVRILGVAKTLVRDL